MGDRLAFVAGLYAQRAALAFHGHVRRDPMARLHLRAGRDDPYAVYEQLRRAGTLVPTRMGNWATTSHRVCNAVLRDRQFFVRPPGAPGARDGFDLSFLDMDPPDHTRLRRVAQPAFSPKQMESYRPRVLATVDTLLGAAAREGTFDLVGALAAPLPIAVITDLMGIPDADADRFARIGATFGSALDGVRSPRHAARLVAAGRELKVLFEDLFALRRAEPADDVISRIVAAGPEAVRPEEMVPLCDLLLVAGFETTVNLVGNAVNALLDHPAQWAALCADPAGLAGAAVEETLRWDSPVQRTLRFAHTAQTLEDREVRAGQAVIPLLGAANRDPEVFPDPDTFDIFRPNSGDHLAFSGGIHYCVGRPLALLEATIAVERLATRMPGLRRAGPVKRRTSSIIRGPIRLPVRAA